jgi:copper ion binding protein
MTTLTVKVPNISCAHCLHTIKTEVGELSGVKTVEASLESKLVTIGYDDTVTQDKIEARLAEIDYPVEKCGV